MSLKAIASFLRIKNEQKEAIKLLIGFNIRDWKLFFYLMGFKQFSFSARIDFPVKINFKRFVSLGENCSINAFVHIWAGDNGVTIGNRVMIASNTSIIGLTHDYTYPEMRYAPIVDSFVVIKDDAWIGANCVILPGVTIGKGAVVGAGSVVTNDIPDYAIAYGAPAKAVKYRDVTKVVE